MKNLKCILIVLLFFTISCEKNESEWIYLFDGKSTDGWRAYNGKEIPEKWAAIDGELTSVSYTHLTLPTILLV